MKKQKRKRKTSREGFVLTNEFPNFDVAIKEFLKNTLDIAKEVKYKMIHTKKATHSARTKRGKKLQSLKDKAKNKETLDGD